MSSRALSQHRVKAHGFQGKQAIVRQKALAVVSWWDVLDSMPSQQQDLVVKATAEMEARINALREALER